jgi:hypothetical protein
VHEVADVHETRLSIVRVAPAGAGTVAADHVVPFQVCAIAALGTSRTPPTLTHAFVAAHQTPVSSASEAPTGFGVVCSVQAASAAAALLSNKPPANANATRLRGTPARNRLATLIIFDHLLLSQFR